jgi:hypothetical protein
VTSDLLFRELHFQSQWIGEPIRYIGKAGEQVDVDDFGFRVVLLQRCEVSVGDAAGCARKLFDVCQSREGPPSPLRSARLA